MNASTPRSTRKDGTWWSANNVGKESVAVAKQIFFVKSGHDPLFLERVLGKRLV